MFSGCDVTVISNKVTNGLHVYICYLKERKKERKTDT